MSGWKDRRLRWRMKWVIDKVKKIITIEKRIEGKGRRRRLVDWKWKYGWNLDRKTRGKDEERSRWLMKLKKDKNGNKGGG